MTLLDLRPGDEVATYARGKLDEHQSYFLRRVGRVTPKQIVLDNNYRFDRLTGVGLGTARDRWVSAGPAALAIARKQEAGRAEQARRARAEHERAAAADSCYREALARVRHYLAMRAEEPPHQSGDVIHAIHAIHTWTTLRFSDLVEIVKRAGEL